MVEGQPARALFCRRSPSPAWIRRLRSPHVESRPANERTSLSPTLSAPNKRPFSLFPPSSSASLANAYAVPSDPLFPLAAPAAVSPLESGLERTENLVRELEGVEVDVAVEASEEGGATKKRKTKSAPRTSRACCAFTFSLWFSGERGADVRTPQWCAGSRRCGPLVPARRGWS